MTNAQPDPIKAIEVQSVCGLVMPISSIDGCNEQHWVDVKSILFESIQEAGFEPNLVSDADDVGIIQKRIIQNLYSNPIVVCDVSGKNPNVMFELGIRLAFDKPTIIVKDDKTSYSFDTSPIEHLTYPRDLRFNRIINFKSELTKKISNTAEKAKSDPSYTTFLKNFGQFTVAALDTKEVSKEEFILDEIVELRRQMDRLISRKYSPRDIMYNERGHESKHLYSSKNECIEKIANGIKIMLEMLGPGSASNSLINNPQFVIKKCKELNLLPECFDDECTYLLDEAMEIASINKISSNTMKKGRLIKRTSGST
jgi:hypothetical protein